MSSSFFLLEARAVLSSFRSAGEGCTVERAIIKATSSCLSMMLRQETCKKERNGPVTLPVVASNTQSRPVLSCRDTPLSSYCSHQAPAGNFDDLAFGTVLLFSLLCYWFVGGFYWAWLLERLLLVEALCCKTVPGLEPGTGIGATERERDGRECCCAA